MTVRLISKLAVHSASALGQETNQSLVVECCDGQGKLGAQPYCFPFPLSSMFWQLSQLLRLEHYSWGSGEKRYTV